MEARDVFDVVLVVLVSVALYVELYGTTTDGIGAVDSLLEALLAVDPIYYLVLGGVLGVAFVSYITIYLPQKHTQRPSRQS